MFQSNVEDDNDHV